MTHTGVAPDQGQMEAIEMRKGILLAALVAAVGLVGGGALADHFDGNASTGSFNPQMTVTVSQTLVNRPTTFSMLLTQQDHEDPPIYAAFRGAGDWQFAWTSTRVPETTGGVPTTTCSQAIDGYRNSPNGTGTGTNVDFSKRTDAQIARAEKIGRGRLVAHADGVSRPGSPIVWTGDVAFITYDPVTETGEVCALLITTDSRVTSIPDPSPSGRDDIEDITEIVAQFGISRVTDASGTWWQVLVDDELEDLIKSEELQTLNASLLELKADFNGMSDGNWQVGGPIAFSRAPANSGVKTFQSVFKTCPAADPDFGNCFSGRPDVVRNATFTFSMVAPAITAPANNTLTNANPVTVTGTSDPFATVQVYDGAPPGGTAAGATATADAAGVWSASVPLSDGSHTIHARAVDTGGTSAPSNTRTLTVDTTPPSSPLIASPAPGALLAGTSVTLNGTTEPNASVDLVDGGLPLGSTNASATGVWTFTTTMAKGPHAVQARGTDIAGNTGAFGAVRMFDVTTAIPIVASPVQNAATNNVNVTFSGSAEPGATVDLDEGGSPVGLPAVAGMNGAWSISATLPEGDHTINARATAGGFTSPPAVRTLTVDLTPPAMPAITAPSAGAVIRSISVPVSGTTEPFASITVFEGAKSLGGATAGAGGTWNATVVLADGEHTIRAVATDRAGNAGPSSDTVTFTVDDPLEIVLPAQDSLNRANVTVVGNADVATQQVRVYEGLIELGRATVTNGTWTLPLTMPTGVHTLTVRSVTNGVLGPVTSPRRFRVDASNPIVKIRKPQGYLLFGTQAGDPIRGEALDTHPADSGIARIELLYVEFVTGKAFKRIAVCDAGCPRQQAYWTEPLGVPSGFYEVHAKAFDVAGNSGEAESLFLLIM